jgi:hypothetical protein
MRILQTDHLVTRMFSRFGYRGEGVPESSSPKREVLSTEMALEDVPRCQHIKVNGVQCGSPALRRRAHCFFHTRAEHERQLAIDDRSGRRTFGFPLLEDANSIQVALMKVIQMHGAGVLDHKSAGLMLYALQTASANLRLARFEPEKLTEVVIDEDTVDLTRLSGPQWSRSRFRGRSEIEGGNQANRTTRRESRARYTERKPQTGLCLRAKPESMCRIGSCKGATSHGRRQ